MRIAAIAPAVALVAATLWAADSGRPAPSWEVAVRTAAVVEQLQQISLAGLAKSNEAEVAAFIVAGPDGTVRLERWSDGYERHRQTFRGSVLPGTIAIVHTHPPGRSPRPSAGDCELARSSGLPVITLTRWAVWVVEPGAAAARSLVERRNWMADAAQLTSK